VKILLEREEVKPDKPGHYGWTPLMYASSSGHEGVLKILLEREDVNPNKPGNFCMTSLALAASSGKQINFFTWVYFRPTASHAQTL